MFYQKYLLEIKGKSQEVCGIGLEKTYKSAYFSKGINIAS